MKILSCVALMLVTALTPAFAKVSVNSPANGATVGSSVHYVASASTNSCSKYVASMGIYVDNRLTYVVRGSSLNKTLSLTPGKYHTVVEEWDYCGGASYTTINIVVAKSGGVSVSSPANNSSVSSPVHYVATATSTNCAKGVVSMGVYVNNRLTYVTQGASLNTQVSLGGGPEHTVVEEWDYCGGASYTPVNLTVGSSSPGIQSVQVSCNPTSLPVNATSQCSAKVNGTGNYSSAVRWYANDGIISPTGLYTAPATGAVVTVTATSVQDSTKSGEASIDVQLQMPRSKHVVVVMEENQSYSTVVHNTGSWPNLNNLIANGALPTNYYGDTHPSIGNYFMLTTGQLLTNNDNSTAVWNVDNLARRMLAAGVSFRIYAEGIPRGYVGGNTGPYLIRHNPFAMLSDIAGNPQVAQQTIWPFSQFAADVANGSLPEFSFIVPDVNDDAHNGTPQQADAWLHANVVVPLSNESAFVPGGDGLLIVGFDEASTSDSRYGGGHVAAVIWGPNVRAGYTQTSNTVYQHQSVLHTVMDALGLPNPPAAAAAAPSMAEFFLQK